MNRCILLAGVSIGLPLLVAGLRLPTHGQPVPQPTDRRFIRDSQPSVKSSVPSRPSALIEPIVLPSPDPTAYPAASDRSPVSGGPRVHAHPHGHQMCASGCALSHHPTQQLTSYRFTELIRGLRADEQRCSSLDELLYYGPQTLRRLSLSVAGLRPEDRTLLQHELAKSQVQVRMRLMSEAGVQLAELPEQIVPLDIRYEYRLITNGLPPVEVSGTIKRVGRYDLWSRF